MDNKHNDSSCCDIIEPLNGKGPTRVIRVQLWSEQKQLPLCTKTIWSGAMLWVQAEAIHHRAWFTSLEDKACLSPKHAAQWECWSQPQSSDALAPLMCLNFLVESSAPRADLLCITNKCQSLAENIPLTRNANKDSGTSGHFSPVEEPKVIAICYWNNLIFVWKGQITMLACGIEITIQQERSIISTSNDLH